MLRTTAARAARFTQRTALLLAVASTAALGACQDTPQDQGLTGPSASQSKEAARADVGDDEDDSADENTVYEQVEFLGNPLVSEVTIVKANHDKYNRTQPYNTAEFGAQSLAFINAFRGNQPVVANTLGAVLYPDMLIVESSRNPSTSGWLSWALANGWGGRNLKDDVVDAGLSAIFGKIITADGAYCNNGELPLCTDNVPANDKAFLRTFPYLAGPTL
ncbi:DUF4331 family protein [Gemmatimonas groenlandica]|uniref:DUF4331 family protein n=1 Tax=Gemmatimonas groenlandica TaxID=2732249 RepID=A0A6M4INV2_9BACT|nr:DUF4331 family protein [Gemmatimonas groenlandica]QJR35419.1 DUF4331 family protein [Gemmatimonas groenlandica]